MRFTNLITPYRSLSDEERLNLIRQMRFRRNVEKPRRADAQRRTAARTERKETTSKVKKAQLALDMLTPEQIDALRKMHNL